jgi:capsular exopolysaccharide synthesis family protein
MKSAEEVEAVVGRPTLGMVPSMPGNGDRTIAERAMRTHLQPTSLEAEAFRTIRTAIYFSSVVEGTKTILVTSSAPGEGKTIVAANLAIAMAQAGQKTLLLDADFRRPCVHKAFELDKEEGVSTLVLDETSLESAVKRTEVHGLDILTCGERPPNPAEMLGSQKFAELMEHLTGMYDRVIVDSPPVLAVADSQILSRICGGVVAVVRARQSSRIDVARMRDSLAKVGGKLMGVVVNDIPRGRNGYYYGSKYYRYYDYYNKDDESGGNGEKPERDVEVLVEDGVLSPHIRTRQWPWRGKPLES